MTVIDHSVSNMVDCEDSQPRRPCLGLDISKRLASLARAVVFTDQAATVSCEVTVLHSHWSRSLQILCSDWWKLTMLVPRSMPLTRQEKP